MKHKTLIDIAKKAGVSPSTVSRALRNHPGISKKTIEHVKKIADKFNFRPNPIAQGLKNNTTRTIGVIVPEITHDFFASAIGGIEEIIYKSGYTLILCQSNEEYEREVINIDTLINHRVAGILASISEKTFNGKHFRKVLDRKIPLVFFDRVCDDIETSKVIFDDKAGAFNAVSFLIKKGYRNIVHFAGPENLSNSKQRYLGYIQALKANKIDVKKGNVYFGGMNECDGYKSMDIAIKEKRIPDAIFAVNDPVALGAFQRIKEEGLKIPKDIALIGFSNNKVLNFIEPRITTVNQSSFDMGKKAAEVLINKIENSRVKNETIVLNTELIIRDSA